MNERNPIEVRDMLKSRGWQIVKKDIEEQIKSDLDRILNIDINKHPDVVGAEYIKLRQHQRGLEEIIATAEKYYKL